jgi:hypothetical protein
MCMKLVGALVVIASISSCAFSDNRAVSLLPEHLQCEYDTECTEAVLACSSCGEAIAKRSAETLVVERQRLCRYYRGPVVDCLPSGGAVCASGRCALAPPDHSIEGE